MKALVAGLGSMGKRRVRNLQALGVEQVVGFDRRADRREEAGARYGIQLVESFDQGLAQKPDVVLISLPPDLHVSFARRSVSAGIPFFSEASVVLDGMADLLADVRAAGVVAFPSCTMRYFPGPRTLKSICRDGRIGAPLAWQYQSGQYLPDWHPWESIQDFYVSNPPTGGCREIVPFELCWLTEVFGPVASLQCQKAKLTDLPAPIDDIYQLQVEHANGVLGQLTVDVISRVPVRLARILGTQGTVEWDGDRNLVRLFNAADGAWKEISFEEGTKEKGYINPEEPYIAEIADFLACVREGRQPVYSLAEDEKILNVLYAADDHAKGGVARASISE
jgi:predicted dehydrogenase